MFDNAIAQLGPTLAAFLGRLGEDLGFLQVFLVNLTKAWPFNEFWIYEQSEQLSETITIDLCIVVEIS